MGNGLVHRQIQCHHGIATVGSCKGLRVSSRLRVGLTVPHIVPASTCFKAVGYWLVDRQVQSDHAVAAICSLERLDIVARLRVSLPVPRENAARCGIKHAEIERDTVEHKLKILRPVLGLKNRVAGIFDIVRQVFPHIAHQVALFKLMVGKHILRPS